MTNTETLPQNAINVAINADQIQMVEMGSKLETAETSTVVVPDPLSNHPKVRIVYNPYNIDSTYAVCLVVERLKQFKPDVSITAVSYYFDCRPQTPESADLLVVCTGHISAKDLFQEIQGTGASTVIQFMYDDCKPEDMKIGNGVDYRAINPHWHAIEERKNSSKHDSEHIYADSVAENSIAVLANDYFRSLGYGTEMLPEQKRLMMTISSYINFMQFNSIFVKEESQREESDLINEGRIVRRSENDLVFLYQNMQGIRDSAARGESYLVKMSKEEDPYEFKRELHTIRRLISRNMTEEVYTYRTKLTKIQTTCVGEEHAVEVMRQLSYAFPTTITYEDIQGYRIWRILCNDEQIIGMLREALEPVKEWRDCRIIYFASEPLKRERK